jgi:hypothetical protein
VSTEKKASYIEEVAPTPHWGDNDATMDALIRARLCESQRMYEWYHHRMRLTMKSQLGDKSPEHDHSMQSMMVSLLAFVSNAVEADLLMTIQSLVPDADKFARDFIGRGESGDYYPEMLWDWLEQRGIDPERVRSEALAEIAESEVTK